MIMRESNEVFRYRKWKVRRGGRVGEGFEVFLDSNFFIINSKLGNKFIILLFYMDIYF